MRHGYQTAVEIALLIGMVAGAAFGWRRYVDICSDPQCGVTLPADASMCPRCGGRIRGVIRSASDRLSAEENLPPDSRSSPYR